MFQRNLGQNKRAELLPFTAQGIEVISVGSVVILNIYGGTVLHLRGDVLYPGGYMAFTTDKPTARVVRVNGTALYSSEQNLIKKRLRNYFATSVGQAITGPSHDATKLPDGSFVGRADLTNPDYQSYFQPRIENLEKNMNISDFYCSGRIRRSAAG